MELNIAGTKALPRATDYAGMVRGLFTKELGGIDGQRMHATIGISGECAELIPAHLLGNEENLVEEAGDAFFYFQALLNMTGYELTELFCMGSTIPVDLMEFELAALNYAAGELLDLSKKCWVYGKEYDSVKFKQAMADWLICFGAFINGQYDLSIEDCMAHNQNKLVTGEKARYKGGAYSDAAAIARADKVELNEQFGKLSVPQASEQQVVTAADVGSVESVLGDCIRAADICQHPND